MAYPRHGDHECQPRRILADYSDLDVNKPSLGRTRSLSMIRNSNKNWKLNVSRVGKTLKIPELIEIQSALAGLSEKDLERYFGRAQP